MTSKPILAGQITDGHAKNDYLKYYHGLGKIVGNMYFSFGVKPLSLENVNKLTSSCL